MFLRAATPKHTRGYVDRMIGCGVSADNYRVINGVLASSIGIGTYLGDADEEVDQAYFDAIVGAVESGINLIDTAINYRFQRSERTIGAALRELVASGRAEREEILIATKGGFIPFDGVRPADSAAWVDHSVVARGLAKPDEIVRSGHCMTPAFLRDQMERSLTNLGVETIDLYYLHNPETQLREIDRREFLLRLTAAFAELERAVAEGLIRGYGVATWNGFRVDPEHRQYLSVEEVVRVARAAADDSGHHLCAIQMPYNVAMHEALSFQNQTVAGGVINSLEAANGRGVQVIASSSLQHAELTSGLPDVLAEVCPGLRTDAQRALQFARSTPGIASALVGMSQPEHVAENVEVARATPASASAIVNLFS